MFGPHMIRWIGCLLVGLSTPMLLAQDTDPADTPTVDPPSGQAQDPETPDAPAPVEQADPAELAAQRELQAQALRDQLDAAQHLAEELELALDEQGLLAVRTPYRQQTLPQQQVEQARVRPAELRSQLTELATRAGLLLLSTDVPTVRFVLLQTQARAYNALAQDAAQRGEELETTRRLRQLRTTGQSLRRVDRPEADATGSYWVLLADLADANRADAPVEARQALAREFLHAYVDQFDQDQAGQGFVLDARLALARLYDQSGDQRAVARQIVAIDSLGRDDPRRRELELLRASVARIGRAVELELATTRGLGWRLENYRDGPVLVHIFADGSVGNAEMIQELTRKIARSARGGFTVVSLRVGPEARGSKRPAWPTLIATGRERQVLGQFGVSSSPTLVWLDSTGRIAAVGQTLEVFDRIPDGPVEPIDLQDLALDQTQTPDPESDQAPSGPTDPAGPEGPGVIEPDTE